MKTKSLFFAVLVALSTTAFAGGDDPGMTIVHKEGSEVFKVIYKGAATGKVKVNVYDPQGRIIHSETISGLAGFICPLNFKGLKYGDYTIELVDRAGRYQEEVTFGTTVVTKSIHMTKLIGGEGKFLLAIANARNEPIEVKILEDGVREIFHEGKTIRGDFAQVYKLPNHYAHYTFEISDAAGNKKYFKF